MATASVSPSRSGGAAPFIITAADGSPLPIPHGEWFSNTKARVQRTMTSSKLSINARRVHDCLGPATMGFRQELAVIMERGRERPLTPADVAQKTGMSFHAIRGALEELENEGLAQRVSADGGKLRKGQVLIYSWAFPREPKCKEDSGPRETESYMPEGLSDSVISLVKRLRLKATVSQIVLTRELKEELEEDARIIAEAERRFSRKWKTVPANASLYKEERTDRTEERTEGSSSSFVEYSVEPEAPEPTTTTLPKPLSFEPATEPELMDVQAVIAAAEQYHSIKLSPADAVEMVEHCREQHRDRAISPTEVARFVPMVDTIRHGGAIKSPRRFLRTAVARQISPQELAVLRDTRPTPALPVYDVAFDDDPEVESTRCHRCGGLTTHFLSGRVSPCACSSGPPGRIQ